jgi:para-nitrobenzyl esterase
MSDPTRGCGHLRVLRTAFRGWMFVCALLAAGCGGSGNGPGNGSTDTGSPAVVSCSPADGASAVPWNAVVTVVFSEVMDPSTLTPETFRVQSASGAVAGTVTASGVSFTFTPARDLEDATRFEAVVSAGVKDRNGHPMPREHRWSFVTDVKPWAGQDTVRTLFGRVKGFEDRSETWVWKAIPFARPPVGPLRWKAPQEPEPWQGTREETRFSESCTQFLLVEDIVVGGEDCLYLNIWRPRSAEQDLPVYVWIHGGGNSIGSGGLTEYSGANLAQRSGLVVVNVNYRLGPMGWFSYSALRTGEPADRLDDSGNYGTLDLVRALEFVRDNVRAFGGDPGNVTIAGESAGARNVLSLLISPPAAGLFHRAIAQSGGITTNPVETGEQSARDVMMQLLVKDGTAADAREAGDILDRMTVAEKRAYLASKTSGEILSCYRVFFGGMITFPNLFRDGAVIPLEGFDTLTDGTYPNKVPLIVGSNKEEKKLFIFTDPYFEGKDDLYQVVASYASDAWKSTGVDEVARRMNRHPDQPGVYAYQFLWGAGGDTGQSVLPDPWGFKLGSCHTLEIPFFLGNDEVNVAMQLLVFNSKNEPGRKELTRAMMRYAASFARTGNPNGPGDEGLPRWDPWTPGEGRPKCVLWDADNSGTLHVEMSSRELTESGVKARMAEEVPEPLYSEAKEYLGW